MRWTEIFQPERPLMARAQQRAESFKILLACPFSFDKISSWENSALLSARLSFQVPTSCHTNNFFEWGLLQRLLTLIAMPLSSFLLDFYHFTLVYISVSAFSRFSCASFNFNFCTWIWDLLSYDEFDWVQLDLVEFTFIKAKLSKTELTELSQT